jgi:hypothetical protein
MLRLSRTLIALACTAASATCLGSSAGAQTGVYVAFTGARPNPGADWLYGPTFGIYQDRHSVALLHLGVDFRGGYLTGKNSNSIVDGLGGFRASVVPHIIPFKVYGEGLGGASVVDVGADHFTRFTWQVNGGLEYTFFPRFDWRVAEVSYSGFVGNTGGVGNPLGLSTGIVFRLP